MAKQMNKTASILAGIGLIVTIFVNMLIGLVLLILSVIVELVSRKNNNYGKVVIICLNKNQL